LSSRFGCCATFYCAPPITSCLPIQPTVKFVGLWDTVAAYGLPLEEMTRIVSLFFFPLGLCSDRLPSFVKKACHALSLDDERKTFHPLLIREAPEDTCEPNESGYRTVARERITQVWFAGVHANVGGGYPDDSMAHVPLKWVVDQVREEIRFKLGPDAEPDALRQIATSCDIHGRLYNSRSGMAAYYRYAPRSLTNICAPKCINGRTKIHGSVLERIGQQVHAYAPIGLPESYDLVDNSDTILPPDQNQFETKVQAHHRFQHRNLVWNLVLRKRIIYLAIVATTGLLLTFPFIASTGSSLTCATWFAQLSDIIRVLGAPTSYFTSFWSEAYARRPVAFLVMLSALLFSLSYHSKLKSNISDAMLEIWTRSRAGELAPLNRNMLYKLRTNAQLQGLRTSIASVLAPAVVMFLFLTFGLFSISHLIFNFADSAGAYCKSTASDHVPEWRSAQGELLKIPASEPFPLDALCWNSGFILEPGRYTIFLEATDGLPLEPPHSNAVPPVENIFSRLASPLKRSWARPPNRLVLRVGRFGYDENFLDPDPDTSTPSRHADSFRVSHKASLFLYANQPVLPLLGAETLLYPSKSKGRTATLSIQRNRF